MIFTYAILVLTIIVSLSLVTYYITAAYIESRVGKDVAAFADQTGRALEQYIDQMDRSAAIIMYDTELNATIDQVETNEPLSNPDNLAMIKRKLRTIASLSTDIYNISLFTDKGGIYSFLDDEISFVNLLNWRHRLEASKQYRILIPLHLSYAYTSEKSPVISIFRQYEDLSKNVIVGQMKIDLRPQFIKSMEAAGKLGQSSTLWIVDGKRGFLYPDSMMNKQPFEMDSFFEYLAHSPANSENSAPYFTIAAPQGQKIFSYYYSKRMGVYVISGVLSDEMIKPLHRIRLWIFIASLACSILALIACFVIARGLTKSIRQLRDKMSRISRGVLDTPSDDEFSADEIGHLNRGFHKMVDRIKQLIEEVYETKLREQESQLLVLNSQVDPHFLYNTLEAVSVTARAEGANSAPQMCYELSSLLRYSLENPGKLATVREEMEQLGHYLNLMQKRYADRLTVLWHIDPMIGDLSIPRFGFQPIVENMFRHAFVNCYPPYLIRISAKRSAEGEGWELSFTDNGGGISPEEIRYLTDKIRYTSLSDQTSAGGALRQRIGLMNVYGRLSHYFGDGMRMDIVSGPGTGTTIRLFIPTTTKGGEVG